MQSARLGFNPEKKEYVLEGKLADDTVRTLTGVRTGNRLVLESQAEDQTVHQVTLKLLNDKRTLLLHQTRAPRATQFTRVAEVGLYPRRHPVGRERGHRSRVHRHRRPGNHPARTQRPKLLGLLHRLPGSDCG